MSFQNCMRLLLYTTYEDILKNEELNRFVPINLHLIIYPYYRMNDAFIFWKSVGPETVTNSL